jgi:E3 ubiquitin-protein ligase UHRF1
MYVKVRTVDGKTNTVITISKLTSVEEFRVLVERKLAIERGKQRFFYRGKQLEDGYRMFDYDVRLNDVIQLMIKPDCETPLSPSKAKVAAAIESKHTGVGSGKSELKLTECSSKYYKVGDFVDARIVSYGAWFEGKIVRLVKSESDKIHAQIENGTRIKGPDVDSDDIHSSTESKKEQDEGSRSSISHIGEELEDDGLVYLVTLEEYEDDPPVKVTFEHVRPRARHKFDFSDLKVNNMVMANYNIENPKVRGYWYDVRITAINKTTATKEIIGDIYMGRDIVLLENCRIILCDDVFKIEKPTPIDTSSIEMLETAVVCQNAPSCSRCCDNPHVKCKECSCYVCGVKDDPDTQLLCDECNMACHIRCLNPPLESVPECDEWYCPECKNDENEIVKAGGKLKDSKKKAKLPSKNSSSVRDWGKGMACVGRTKECTLVPPNHFGPIPGIEVGTCWLYRVQVSESGVHRPPVSGIHGRESDGAYSIVLSGGYEDDIDSGDEFLYTGSGGRDLSGNKRTADQSCDQTLTRLNKALALNCNAPFSTKGAEATYWKGGKPVRVVRSCKLRRHSQYAPEVGNRYDGLYKVVKYYPEKGKSGFIVWRYLLRRDDSSPAPWTLEGKKLIDLHGLDKPMVPEGYLEASKEEGLSESKKRKRLSDTVLGESIKKAKTVAYKLDDGVKQLIKQDVNTKLWQSCGEFLKAGKKKYIAQVAEAFMCICCQELVHKPITTPCKHNICKSCLWRSFAAEVYTCPCCRYELVEKHSMNMNETLAAILSQLFPGYESGR